jgi:hypothetical protein
MSCASSTTTKSNGGRFASPPRPARRASANIAGTVISAPRSRARRARARRSTTASCAAAREARLAPSRATSRYASQLVRAARRRRPAPIRSAGTQAELVPASRPAASATARRTSSRRRGRHGPKLRVFVEPPADGGQRMHVDAARRAAGRCRSAAEPRRGARRRAGRRRSSAARAHRDGARQVDGAVQRDDRSCRCRPSPRRAPARCSRARRLPLRGVEEDVHFSHGARARARAPRRSAITRNRRWASGCSNGSASGAARRLRHARRAAGRQLQQRLGRLGRQVVGEAKQRVLGRLPHVAQPLAARRSRAAPRRPRPRRAPASAPAAGRRGRLALASTRRPRDTISCTVSRISTICAAPVVGCVSSFRRSAQGTRRRGGRRSTAAGSNRSVDDQPNVAAFTRTDQKFLSFALSSLWNCMPGLAGLSCRSNAVVLTAFCSSPLVHPSLPGPSQTARLRHCAEFSGRSRTPSSGHCCTGGGSSRVHTSRSLLAADPGGSPTCAQ